MANKVWNQSSKTPVIWTIFEEIHDWHCVVGKTMYKQCFKYTLSIMKYPAIGSNSKKNQILLVS